MTLSLFTNLAIIWINRELLAIKHNSLWYTDSIEILYLLQGLLASLVMCDHSWPCAEAVVEKIPSFRYLWQELLRRSTYK